MKSKILIVVMGVLGLFSVADALACYNWEPNCSSTCGTGSTCIGNNSTGDYVWDFTSRGNDSTYGSWDFASSPNGGPGVTASAWQNSTWVMYGNDSNYGTGDLNQTKLTSWDNSGLGVGNESTSTYEHSVENVHQIDSILLAFDDAVTLKQVAMGWTYNDYDFTIAAYKGAGAPDLDNLAYSALNAANGWTLIESHYDTDAHTSTTDAEIFDVNTGGVSSSYWLISALNTQMGGTQDTTYKGWTKYDYFKLCAVSATPSGGGGTPSGEIPEPSVVSLLLTGLLFAGYMRMRKGSNEAMTLKA